MTTERKLFTAEIKRLQERGGAAPNASNAEVLKAISDLRADLRHLVAGGESPPPVSVPVEEAQASKMAEVSMLKTELRALAVCIEHTKAEIAALKPREADDDRLIAVTFELDAIVSSTERATEQILEASEKIEAIGKEIQAHAADGYISRLVEDIGDTIGTIFEACNFQDITGQRITKVVKTLKYVEDRINAMIEIWGSENIADVSPKIFEEHRDDDSKLLNGPQLENKGISQAEIDNLFG
ncbi:MAG: protein phosphatase CheZ [Phaeospirillum sp.]|nr:protein phosphatase CheZ [Phaeospirillum sp.]